MGYHKLAQQGSAGRRQSNPHFALVFLSWLPDDRAGLLHTVDQLDCAVMLDEHARGYFTDGWLRVLRETVHSQQKLVLLGFDAVRFGRRFTEVEELANLSSEFRQIAVLIW